MKKYLTIIVSLFLFAGTISAQSATATKATSQKQVKKQKSDKKANKNSDVIEAGTLYAFGVAFNPTDSVVYMTDELMLEKAQIHKKTKFLVNRDDLSYQLRDYMTSQGLPNRTCSITFAKSVNDLDKKYNKQVARFKKKGYLLKFADQTVFRFKTVRIDVNE